MDFYALCRQLNLGKLIAEPVQLYGGLLHTMYRVATEDGVYAVKHLNPHVMARPTAAANLDAAEELERKLEKTNLPLLPALTIGGHKKQALDGDFFYVFPYFEGAALTDGEVTPAHCAIVGGLLAQLHRVERVTAPVPWEPLTYDWGEDALLWELQQAANAAAPLLPPLLTPCHNDMDPKNVLWQGLDCRIIDLECLGYGSPYLELLETALCWAGYESGEVDLDRFTAFVGAYAQAGGDLAADWETVYDANCGRLGWLHYNLCRADGSEGEDAIALGKTEVAKTRTCLRGYAKMKENIVGVMEQVKKEGLE